MTLIQEMPQSSSGRIWEYEQPLPRGIFAAVDGSAESIEALSMASNIAGNLEWPLHVVSVISPSTTHNPSRDLTGALRQADQLQLALRTELIRDLISGKGKEGMVTYEITIGEAEHSIVSAAECGGAGLIVCGRRTHGPVDRLIGNETTLHIMRSSRIPVLAVCAAPATLKQVVLATDFSRSSVRAAHVAAELMAGIGTIHLVHVDEPREVIAGIPLHEDHAPRDVFSWVRRLSASLTAQSRLTVAPGVLSGDPVDALLEFSERIGADMIAVGSHGYSPAQRFFLGSVSNELARRSALPVLVVRDVS